MAQSLSNLAVGTLVKFGRHSIEGEPTQEIIWRIVAKSHSGYPDNSVTLFADKIIDMRPFDAQESGGVDYVKNYGNNAYNVSNIEQWLNSNAAAGQWYTPAHTYDQSPSDARVLLGETGYEDRPGFLNLFTAGERDAILPTTIYTGAPKDSGYAGSITRKVFLPSVKELNDSYTVEGVYWGLSKTPTATLTQQAYSNTLATSKPSSVSDPWYYWTRSAGNSYPHQVAAVNTSGGMTYREAAYGSTGIRPVVNLPSTLSITDTIDSDGCYAFIWNVAPPAPTTLYTNVIYGGKSNPISWTKVTDPDGDAITYTLECSINGGEYAQIYRGTGLSYAHLVPFGTSTVRYRVKATDPSGESSPYTTSATVNVVNNNAPIISGTDANLGVKSSGFTGAYTITDADGNEVNVTEAIDGKQIRAFGATLGNEITYSVSGNTWLALSNGSHTLTITATDGIDTMVRTYTFTKRVDTLTIQNSTPLIATEMPTRIMLVVTKNIPSAATFKVEVCNNGYDTSPAWEDATAAVASGLVHVFTNKTKTASNWGVLVKVTVARNGATGACYISAIGGNFE